MRSLKQTIAGAALSVILGSTVPGLAADMDGPHAHSAGEQIHITSAWARPTIGQVPNSAAYFTVTNHGTDDDRLLAVSCPCAAKAELHQTTMKDGVMHMEAIDGGLALPAGQSVSFEPGAMHVMLMGVTNALTEGQTISLTLSFEHAAEQTIAIPVQKAASNTADDPHAGMEMEHGAHHH